jgi:hypothetical protein
MMGVAVGMGVGVCVEVTIRFVGGTIVGVGVTVIESVGALAVCNACRVACGSAMGVLVAIDPAGGFVDGAPPQAVMLMIVATRIAEAMRLDVVREAVMCPSLVKS